VEVQIVLELMLEALQKKGLEKNVAREDDSGTIY
jgi:hypothetical protein